MEEENLVLEREFSELAFLQHAHVLYYKLKADAQGCELWLQDGITQEHCCLPGLNFVEGKKYLRFLYENAVTMENWRDVLLEMLEKAGKSIVMGEEFSV